MDSRARGVTSQILSEARGSAYSGPLARQRYVAERRGDNRDCKGRDKPGPQPVPPISGAGDNGLLNVGRGKQDYGCQYEQKCSRGTVLDRRVLLGDSKRILQEVRPPRQLPEKAEQPAAQQGEHPIDLAAAILIGPAVGSEVQGNSGRHLGVTYHGHDEQGSESSDCDFPPPAVGDGQLIG